MSSQQSAFSRNGTTHGGPDEQVRSSRGQEVHDDTATPLGSCIGTGALNEVSSLLALATSQRPLFLIPAQGEIRFEHTYTFTAG